MTRTTLLVMAKEPVPGRVKTRLCPPCTPDEAASVAEAALTDTLEVVAASGADRLVLALDGAPGPWLPPGFEVVPQQGAGLADRLTAAWSTVDGPCIQVGMDTPQLTSDLLDRGIDLLVDRAPAALGPATDGGWWAIGMRHPDPSVFTGVPMSTSATGALQQEALRRRGLEAVLLPALCDIDRFLDARQVAQSIPRSRTAAAVAAVERRLSARVHPIGSPR